MTSESLFELDAEFKKWYNSKLDSILINHLDYIRGSSNSKDHNHSSTNQFRNSTKKKLRTHASIIVNL